MQDVNQYLSSKEFTDLCGITKNTLIWYEKLGLIEPKFIAENGYRYYSLEQFFEVDIIKTLKWADKSLKECKEYISGRCERNYVLMLVEQQASLERKLTSLSRQKSIVDRTIQDYLSMQTRCEEGQSILSLPETHLLTEKIEEYTPKNYIVALGKLFDFFHQYFTAYGVTPSMLSGTIITKDDLIAGAYRSPSFVSLKINAPLQVLAYRLLPTGEYAVCFHRGTAELIGETYTRLLGYIEQAGYTVCGDAYEFDYINYLVTNDESRCMKELRIPVRRKKRDPGRR